MHGETVKFKITLYLPSSYYWPNTNIAILIVNNCWNLWDPTKT